MEDRFMEPDMEIMDMLFKLDMSPEQFRESLVTNIKSKVKNITQNLNNGKQPSLKDQDDLLKTLNYLNRLDRTDIQPGEFLKRDSNDDKWTYNFLFIEDDNFPEPELKVVEGLFKSNLTPRQGHEKMLNFALRTANRLLVHKSRRSDKDKTNLIRAISFLNKLNDTHFNRKNYFKLVNGKWKVNNPYS